ncbi:cytochrome P450 1A1-like [Mercenaria mercenaria]|uniref:cytochrome P450 1A1-like n=1 Tax=Mercenaria mercenaria TaxID=6596 RepID=UPI00234F5E76|nr:cytochrome P450 1A1-like [Mercenaria mercenaria]
MFELLDIASVICALITLYAVGRWAFSKKKYPPGPWGFPVLGHLPLLGASPEITYLKWWQSYGDVFRIRFGSWNCIVINGYEAIKDASERADDVFSGRPNFVSSIALKEAYGGLGSISFADFSPKYRQLRKLTATALKNYMNTCDYSPEDLFVDEAGKLLQFIDDLPFPICDDVEIAVENVVYQMLYGKGKESEIKSHVKLIVEASAAFVKFVSAGSIVDVVPWLKYIMKGKVEDFKKAALATDWITRAKIKEHKETFQKGQTRDILDALCALSKDLPETETADSISSQLLMYQATAIQGAGFETMSRTLQLLLLYMAAYPELQKRVQKEVDDVIGSKTVSCNDRSNLPYLDATIQEVMRKTTIVPFAIPHCTTADTKLRGYDIDKGTVVFFNLHSVANEKSFWGDPENFRPERFLNDNGKLDATKSSHVMPFGAGRRRCIGEVLAKMNLFITFTSMMQRYSFIYPEASHLQASLGHSPTLEQYKLIVQRRS